MTYDRRTIMQAAWTIARRFAGNRETWGQRLSRALKSAWWDAKEKARIIAATTPKTEHRTAAELRAEIISLENTDKLGWAGMARLGAAKTALSCLIASAALQSA